MTLEELKVRQLTNQYLIDKGEKIQVIKNLNGFQAQFMVNALHSIKLRCFDYLPETVSEGLVKNWTIRGTVHVFAEDDLSLFKHPLTRFVNEFHIESELQVLGANCSLKI